MEKQLLRRLRRGDPDALEAIIERYTPYVSTIIYNQLRTFARPEDVEEMTADTFLALWQHRLRLRTDHLRGWLGTTARNRARSFLRGLDSIPVPEEDVILTDGGDAEQQAEALEQARLVREALDAMGDPDREIFLRFYYYNETTAEIAEAVSMKGDAVKARLRRGRQKLKEKLGDCNL